MAETPRQVDVPAGDLAAALDSLSRQAAVDLVYQPEQVKSVHTEGVKGKYTANAAVRILLKGTPLELHTDPSGAMVIAPAHVGSDSASDTASGNGDKPAQDSESRDRLHLAQAGTGASAGPPAAVNGPGTTAGDSPRLEEIVVTAQKREESSLQVPMSLTAVSGEQLARAQSFRFEDYIGKIPGITFIEDGQLGSQLVIRGLTTGSATVNSTVATYIDETPYTAVGPWAGSNVISPNLDTFDMQRIEVLRGPQGTLYGASALGGLLKYVTNAPDPSGFDSAVEAGVSTVHDGGVGYDVHGMVNLPLSASTAARLVGYTDHYPGFIDEPGRGLMNINASRVTGYRLSLLVAPAQDFSIRFNANYQNRSWDDNNNEDLEPGTLRPVFGDLIQ